MVKLLFSLQSARMSKPSPHLLALFSCHQQPGLLRFGASLPPWRWKGASPSSSGRSEARWTVDEHNTHTQALSLQRTHAPPGRSRVKQQRAQFPQQLKLNCEQWRSTFIITYRRFYRNLQHIQAQRKRLKAAVEKWKRLLVDLSSVWRFSAAERVRADENIQEEKKRGHEKNVKKRENKSAPAWIYVWSRCSAALC